MNIAIWILAVCAISWLGHTVIHANEIRGAVTTLIIGLAGGLLGGMALAPLLGDSGGMPTAFNPFSPLIALAVAATCLSVGNLLSNPFHLHLKHDPA